jgi:hypothetical protein
VIWSGWCDPLLGSAPRSRERAGRIEEGSADRLPPESNRDPGRSAWSGRSAHGGDTPACAALELRLRRDEVDNPKVGLGVDQLARWPRIVLLAAVGVALLPFVLPFTVHGAQGDRTCVAAKEVWASDRRVPPAEAMRSVMGVLTDVPTPAELRDPARRAAWLAQTKANSQSPSYQQAVRYIEWRSGPGACVPGSRHRLILSVWALVVIAATAIGHAWARQRVRVPIAH